VILEIVPETISIRTGSVVVNEGVIRMGNPETSWRLIGVQETHGSDGLDDQVTGDDVLGLGSIFDENVVTFGVVSYISIKSQIVSTVNSVSSVVTLVSNTSSRVRFVNSSNHVEMNSVSTNLESLTHLEHFNVVQSGDQ